MGRSIINPPLDAMGLGIIGIEQNVLFPGP